MESDPLLKKLITQGNEVDEKSVPLTLYTPFGRVSGYTTTGDDFHRYSERELQQLSEVQSVFEGSADDDDYVHLASEARTGEAGFSSQVWVLWLVGCGC